MKVSYNWLQDFIKIDESPEALGEILTAIGLEVEGLEEVESIKGGLKGVVIGKVLTRDKHSGADRLSVTTVDVGQGEPLQIVCGAPNVAAGQKVVIATIGTTLYDKDLQPWKIKKGKIRGEVSEGMICAEDELHMGQSHDGIMVLPEDAPIGMDAADYFHLESDFIYDIGLTPNRSDATSQMGTAKDLLAYFRFHKDAKLDLTQPESENLSGGSPDIEVVLEDEEACPRYSGICLSGLKIGPSPDFIKRRLEALGVRSINNVVDITNYVLHEYGQPLHAFDRDKISDNKIIVKKLSEGSAFITLDEVERKLSKEDLMICDGQEKPMCIGGVFGGIGSGVTDETTRIFLESAYFEAVGIRKSSTRHLLRTDAAKCFEKGTDPNGTVAALSRAVFLLKKYAAAEVQGGLVDIYPQPIKRAKINIDLKTINRSIGADMDQGEVERLLSAMDMEFETEHNAFTVAVPTDKADVTRPADIVEELLRIYGMDNVVFDEKHSYSVNHESFGATHDKREKVASFLVGRGFNEIMGLSLMNKDMFDDEDDLVKINNTSNINLNVMRPGVLLSGLESVAYNLNRQQEELRFFEFGKSYVKQDEGYKESEHLTMIISGPQRSESWKVSDRESADFFIIKSEVSRILEKMGIGGYQVSETEEDIYDYGLNFHRGPQILVSLGKLSKKVLKQFGIKQDVFGAQFNWKPLAKSAFKSFKVQPVSKYPSVRRDIAFVVDKSVTYSQIEQLTKKAAGKVLADIDLFDVYQNDEQLGADKKSYAIKLIYVDLNKTLSDKEVDKSMEAIIKVLEDKLQAEVRR